MILSERLAFWEFGVLQTKIPLLFFFQGEQERNQFTPLNGAHHFQELKGELVQDNQDRRIFAPSHLAMVEPGVTITYRGYFTVHRKPISKNILKTIPFSFCIVTPLLNSPFSFGEFSNH